MFKKGNIVKIKPEFQGPGEDSIIYVVLEDEDGGRTLIEAQIDMSIKPTERIETSRIEFVHIPSLEESILTMKQGILNDVLSGIVPEDVKSFSELHDFTDANCYGGFCEEGLASALIVHFGGRDHNEGMPDGMIKYLNDAQNAIHDWIASGEMAAEYRRRLA